MILDTDTLLKTAGLNDRSRRDVPRVADCLHGQTFLYQAVEGDNDNYYFGRRHRPVFERLLGLAGLALLHDDYHRIFQALLSLINAKKSGGETTTPFYVAMAASSAQAYRLNPPRQLDTIRLALFDEAFSKMDTARAASALQFMRSTGLQVLLATPPDKSGSLLSHVDSVRTVVRQNSHSFVIEIDKAEMLQALQ